MYGNDNRGDFVRKPMVQGNWTCSGCGAAITELPFQPSPDRLDTLLCRDCHRNSRPAHGGDRPARSDRPMVQGNWSCADCGKAITQLPFEPSGDRPVRCSDCHRASRPARDDRRW